MESYNLDNITHNIKFIKKCKLLPIELTNKLNDNVLKNIKNNYENIIQREGYIIPDSIKLLEVGDICTSVTRFDGSVIADVVFTADVIKPTRNSVIECTIKRVNNFAISAIAGPLNLKIPVEDEDTKKFKVDDVIKVRIVNSLNSLHKNFYNIYATLYDKNKKTRMLSEQSISSEKEIDLKAEETDGEELEELDEEEDDEEDVDEEMDEEEDDEEEEEKEEEKKDI